MKPGTLIRLPDGRMGRTVYHGLDGYGIRWGTASVSADALPEFDVMLREPYPHAIKNDIECVGEAYTIVEEPKP